MTCGTGQRIRPPHRGRVGHARDAAFVWSSDRVAALAFAAVLAAAWLWIGWLARYRWFYNDEWDYIVTRRAGDLDSLFAPHNGHWSTLPIVYYRALYHFTGLRSYLPFLGVVIASHLLVAALLRTVMRRSGVRPWIATVVATLFVFYGEGYRNIVSGFQVSFNASLAFGLAHLLLATKAHSPRWKRGVGVVAGILGLMCSGVGLVFVFVVGLGALLARGWRASVANALPLVIAYSAWWTWFGRESGNDSRVLSREAIEFAWHGLRATTLALAQSPLGAVALAAMAVGAVAISVRSPSRHDLVRHSALPVALLGGAVVFLLSTGFERAEQFGTEYAASSRYLHVIAAMLIPSVAWVAEVVARYRSAIGIVTVVVILAFVPGNARDLVDAQEREEWLHSTYRRVVTTIPQLPLADAVPRDVEVDRFLAPRLTVGFLLDAYAADDLPRSRAGRESRDTAQLYVALAQRPDYFASLRTCRRVIGRFATLAGGDAIIVRSVTNVTVRLLQAGRRSLPRQLSPAAGRTFVAFTGPLRLEFEPSSTPREIRHCVLTG